MALSLISIYSFLFEPQRLIFQHMNEKKNRIEKLLMMMADYDYYDYCEMKTNIC